ncbi:MAG: class I SAM-dependent rRNA methyltransferase [Planctomycetes bacterium]|nr:class I SAM-dependent rRNA methyltransferase [Planctomycetota bacterium]MBI3845930.1 class I SAM-dependent rRNA methyltransferase [Planctomycetota bacterium]
MARVFLKRGKAKPFWFRHPWVFSGAVRDAEGGLEDGDVVEVCDDEGRFIARGFYNSQSQISVRLCTWEQSEDLDEGFFMRRVQEAKRLRADILGLPNSKTTAYRLVHGEGDGIPGLIVDVFADVLVVQLSSLGLKQRQHDILKVLKTVMRPRAILEHQSPYSMEKEGMFGTVSAIEGDVPTGRIEVLENGVKFLVDVRAGQKTGFYLDQRENRVTVANLVREKRVFDGYTYTGGFALAARVIGGAAEVVGVDSSADAIAVARENAERNGAHDVRFEEGEVMERLRNAADEGELFDVVVLDPPKFAKSKGDLQAAIGKYRELNTLGMQVLAPDGILVTCSCSQHLTPEMLEVVVNEAAKEAEREAQMLYRGSQGPDHPVRVSCPESRYLKFFVCRLVGEGGGR